MLSTAATEQGTSQGLRRRPTTQGLTLLLLAFSPLLLGCSSSPSASPVARTETTVAVKPGAIVPFTPSRNARGDVHLSSCSASDGGWTATGTLSNKSAEQSSFQIVVDFATKTGDTVLSTTVVDLSKIPAGKTQKWTASGARGGSQVACLLRQAQET
jgi:hypothetical protein